MHRFNLTFRGVIQPGYNPEKVRQRFAALLGIDDPAELERCFSGQTTVLREDLDRKTAADLFRQLNKMGLAVELVRDDQARTRIPAEPPSRSQRSSGILDRDRSHVDQKWAVSNAARAAAEREAAERDRQAALDRARAEREAEQQRREEAAKREAAAQRKRAAEEEQRREAARARARRLERELAAQEKARQRAEEQARRTRAREAAKQAAEARRAEQAAQRQAKKQAAAQRRAREKARAAEQAAARRDAQDLHAQSTPAASSTASPQPNPYALYPFRSTAALRERPRRAQRLMRRQVAIALLAFAALAGTLLARHLLQPPAPVTGPAGAATLHGGGLLLALPDRLLLHDRAGVGSGTLPLAELGLARVSQVVPAANRQHYLVLGQSLPASDDNEGAAGTWRCTFIPPHCETFGPQGPAPLALAVHVFNGMVLQALPAGTGDGASPTALRKLDRAGTVLATSPRPFATHPTLHLLDGLLYTNSTDGPALSVLRYEDNALGAQLDEILLIAPGALEAGRERVRDFAFLRDKWWAILENAAGDDRGLYLFDAQWGFLQEVGLPRGFVPAQLLVWGEKILVRDRQRLDLPRFNSAGAAEATLRSDLLDTLAGEQARRQWLHQAVWQSLAITFLLVAASSAALAYLQRLRQLAFKPASLRGAEPIESVGDRIHWLDRPPGREPGLRRVIRLYLAFACLLLVTCVTLQVPPYQLTALLLFLAGPGMALGLYLRSSPGHVGVLDGNLLLVDHRDTYHVGQGARILYHGWFLMIDDVLVHTGPGWAPGFDTGQLREEIVPLARMGVRVDRRSVLARLVESRHPLAQAIAITLSTTLVALAIVLFNA